MNVELANTLLFRMAELLYLNDGMLEGTIPASYGKLSNLSTFLFFASVDRFTIVPFPNTHKK